METAQQLKEVLMATRQEQGGITLDLVARIITGEFDQAEVNALIEGLNKYK